MRSWTIGAVTITQVVEQIIPRGIPGLLPDATREALLAIPWLYPEFITAKGEPCMSLHAFVIDTADTRILVDTCVGNDKDLAIAPMWHRMQTDFLDKLAAAGFAPETIDIVVCTHLHLDHVGWNTMKVDGRWVPTFPTARYLFGRVEYEFLEALRRDEAVAAGWRECNAAVFAESVQPVVEAGLVDLVEMDHRLTGEVRLTPSIGHTPGHVSIVIESGGSSAIVTGDAVHHPCQLAHPEWGTNLDTDQAAGAETRRRMFGEAGASGQLLLGTHWSGAGAGTVAVEGEAFRLVFEPTLTEPLGAK